MFFFGQKYVCGVSVLSILFLSSAPAMQEDLDTLNGALSQSKIKRIGALAEKYRDTSPRDLVNSAIVLDSERVAATKECKARQKAFEENILLTLAAEKGDAYAMWLKAQLYSNGALAPNPVQQVDYMTRAACNGLPEAQCWLAEFLRNTGKEDQAYAWYQKFAHNPQVVGWQFSDGQSRMPVVAEPYRQAFARAQHVCGAYLLALNKKYEALEHLRLVSPAYDRYADVEELMSHNDPIYPGVMLAGAKDAQAVELFYRGKECFEKNDLKQARTYLEAAAKRNFMPAHYWLAKLACGEKRIAQWCKETDIAALEYVVAKAYESKNAELVRFVGGFLKKKNSATGIYFLTRALVEGKSATDAEQIRSCFKTFLGGVARKQSDFLERQSGMEHLLESVTALPDMDDAVRAWIDQQISAGNGQQVKRQLIEWGERIDTDKSLNEPWFDGLVSAPVFIEIERLAREGDSRAQVICGQYFLTLGAKPHINKTGPFNQELFDKGVNYLVTAYKSGSVAAGIGICSLKRLEIPTPGIDDSLTAIACDLAKRGGSASLSILPTLQIVAQQSPKRMAMFIRVLLEFSVAMNDVAYAEKAVRLMSFKEVQTFCDWYAYLANEGVGEWFKEHEPVLPQLFKDKEDLLADLYEACSHIFADDKERASACSRRAEVLGRDSAIKKEAIFLEALRKKDFEEAGRVVSHIATPDVFERLLSRFVEEAAKDSACAVNLGMLYLSDPFFRDVFSACRGKVYAQLGDEERQTMVKECFARGVKHLKDAIRLDAHNVHAYEALVKYLYEISGTVDDIKLAFFYARKCVEEEKNESAYCTLILSRCLYAGKAGVKQNKTKARALIETLDEKGSPVAPFFKACILCQEGKYAEAVKQLCVLINQSFVSGRNSRLAPLGGEHVVTELIEQARMKLGLMLLDDLVDDDIAVSSPLAITLEDVGVPDYRWAKRARGIQLICSAMESARRHEDARGATFVSLCMREMYTEAVKRVALIEASLRVKKNESEEEAAHRQRCVHFYKEQVLTPFCHTCAGLGMAVKYGFLE